MGTTVEGIIKETLSMKNPAGVGMDGLIEVLDDTRTRPDGQDVPTRSITISTNA